MPAHSLAAARGVRTQTSIENSHRHEHPRSMNYGKEGLDTVSMPNERICREMLIPQRMGPAGSIKSDQETIPRRVRLPATEPRQLLRKGRGVVKRIVAKVRSGSATDESP